MKQHTPDNSIDMTKLHFENAAAKQQSKREILDFERQMEEKYNILCQEQDLQEEAKQLGQNRTRSMPSSISPQRHFQN